MTQVRMGKAPQATVKLLQDVDYRISAIRALVRSLAEEKREFSHDLYEIAVDDLMSTLARRADLFGEIAVKHGWKYSERDNWRVNFKTQEVYLIPQ